MASHFRSNTKVFGLINGDWIEGNAFADKQGDYEPHIYQCIGKANRRKIVFESGEERFIEGEIFVFIHAKNQQQNTKH